MADVKKSIEIIFGAIDSTGSGLASVAKGVGDFSDNISKATKPMSDLGDFALKTEAAIIGLGVAMIGFAVNEASKFQAAQNEIGTLLGANSAQAEAFGKDILNYAKDSTQAIDQITAATYSAISAGAAQADALDVVSTAERLAVAGKADLNSTTIALVSTLNAYGASADQASRYSDVLFSTVRLGQTTLPELAASLSQVTLIAASGGVPIETLGAAIAALTAKGVPTSQAITSIRAALQAMLAPTEGAKNEAERLGLQFDATALKTKGFETVLDDVMRATGGNEAELVKLFGSVEAVKAVLGLAAEDGAKFKSSLEAMQSAAGATEKAFQLMSSNAALAFQNLQNNLKISLITAGMPILEQFGGSVKGLADVFKALTFSIDKGAFDPLYAALGEAAKGLETFLNGIAKALPDALKGVDFTGLAKSFGDIGKAAGGIFGNLDLTKPEDLRKAVQFVVDSVESLNQVVAGIVTAWGPALQTMVTAVAKFNEMSDGAKNATGEALGFAQVFEKVIGPIVGGVTGAVEGLGTAISLLAAAMGGSVLVNIGKFATSLGAASGLGGALAKVVPLLAAAGPLGLVGALGLAGVAAGMFYKSLGDGETADAFAARMKAAKEETESFVEAFNGWKPGQKTIEDVGAASDATAEAIARLTGEAAKDLPLDQYERQVASLTAWDSALDTINASLAENGQVMLDNGRIVEGIVNVYGELSPNIDKAGNAIDQASLLIDESTGRVTGYRGAWDDLTDAQKEAAKSGGQVSTEVKKTAEEVGKAESATRAWNLEMAKLDSAENIALIASQTTIATARIEADTQKMVAAFDSVNAAIASTGEVLASLFDTLGSGDLSRVQQLQLENVLRNEERRRQEAFDLQKKLTESQIKEMQARTEAIKRGDAMIKIEGDGLQPHLEAFMWEILKAIQVRVNADGLDMLLGS